MKVCTLCGAKWRGAPASCPLDGAPLETLPDPLIGRTIAGRYVLVSQIGKGGMGTVYRARHDVVGRDVAIKFLAPDLSMDPTNRRRFLREAKAANRIDHEHIIDITDYGETDDGLVYLVMEYLDGHSLAEIIEKGPLSSNRALGIALQMAGAIARAHELGVIHRDIKPENVFLLRRGARSEDFVKILDFGLAKIKGALQLTASGAVFGTPEYMAPEQARGAPLTGKADLYALGCVLYEMICGEPPFDGAAPDLVLKHIRERPRVLEERVAGTLPQGLNELVMRLLEKAPESRHTDAYHLYEELRQIREGIAETNTFATVREFSFADALRTQLPARKVSPTIAVSAVAWDERIAGFRALAAKQHPDGVPPWLAEMITDVELRVGELARKRRELDRSNASLMESETDIRAARLRMGRAIDELANDESRLARKLEALLSEKEDVERALGVSSRALRARWNEVAGCRWVEEAPARELVLQIREVGELAETWLSAQAGFERLEREREHNERAREDIRFQVAQLKGRLGTLSAEGDIELEALRRESQRLDAEVEKTLDRIAERCASLARHFGLAAEPPAPSVAAAD